MMAAEKRTRTVTGKVISNKADKTITVLVERKEKHPIYGKFVTRSTKLHAHDEQNECEIGDTVTVAESRPLSKSKSWTLVKIEEQAVKV
ncbi:30S ribosomal protein S17 [Amphritea sp. 1_MG-2023]|uniref:30S ribosomal protein S17 n=1 Tax=Amphritea sp. 1_MG-2023 TaxID=3062670 RepID=UPI0026E2184B|nr:30S ribosomal protein S17 [Amphritea sp. 1_MG-2023]MDO6563709.1 30S ribosomal protein S17 [Amphritea sp. 1_MG-2023]